MGSGMLQVPGSSSSGSLHLSILRCGLSTIAGQVHRARLNGQEVVVKVQRPGLKALFDIDLKNLRVSGIQIQTRMQLLPARWNAARPGQQGRYMGKSVSADTWSYCCTDPTSCCLFSHSC